MTSGESRSPSLADVEAVVRENVSGHVDGDRHEQGKQRLLNSLRSRGPRAVTSARTKVIGASLVVALVGASLFTWRQRESAKLTYDVVGGLLSESGYVRSSGPSGARLSFSDGTRVDLQDGARARIAAVDAHGARLAIENGHASLAVTHRPSAAWFVDAGPFVIQVSGTQFDVDWSSYDDTLSVDLHEGSLIVSGPPAPAGVLLRAGQRLTAHEGRLSLEALEQAVRVTEQPLDLPDLSPEAAGVAPLPEVGDSLSQPPPVAAEPPPVPAAAAIKR